MGFINKLKFWKKEDFNDINFDKEFEAQTQGFGPDHPLPSYEQSIASQPSFSQHSSGNFSSAGIEQDIKLLSSKLDTMLAKMDNMNQRIANLERIAEEAQR
jgi:hypothetical protein